MSPLSDPVVKVERLHGGQPILRRIGSHPWESKVTFNPACILVRKSEGLASIIDGSPFESGVKSRLEKHDALCFLLYRAQGERQEKLNGSPSSLGLAVLSPRLELLARHDQPVLLPDKPYDNLGVEDARITKIGGKYILMYTAYASAKPENKIRIAIASTENFFTWEKHGLLKGPLNAVNNKNAILFEEPMGGNSLMLHRPMEGADAMTIHWAVAREVLGEWESRGALMKPVRDPKFKDTWLGGGAPPMRLGNGFLMLYHIGNRTESGVREYDLGIAFLKWYDGSLIVARSAVLMRPETEAETAGDAELGVNNVLFVCGAYFYQEDCYFPYAGADSVVLGGRITKAELERFAAG